MEEGTQASDWDSDETVIEGSVTESDLEEEDLPWRRLLFDRKISLRSESSLHPGTHRMGKGIPSPEIQLGFKLREYPQEQMNENMTMPVPSEDTVLQQSQLGMKQNEALLQTNYPVFTVLVPQTALSMNHKNTQGPETENTVVLPHQEKALSEDEDSPEISLLSGTAIIVSGMVAVNEKSLIEPETIVAQNTFSEPVKKVTLTMTSEETKDEESSIETFVSALERLQTSPENTQEERPFQIMNDFEPIELLNPLSDSQSSTQTPLNVSWACSIDVLENREDDALPAELLAALNTLSDAIVEPICHRKEGSKNLSAGNECVGVEPSMSQTDEGCTQIAEVNFESFCSPPFEQYSKAAELQDKDLSVYQTQEGLDPLGLQTLAHPNVTSCDQLNNQEDSNPVENICDQEIPHVLRRSLRLKKWKADRAGKHADDVYKMPEKNLPKVLSFKRRKNNRSLTKNSSMQDSALTTEGKRKNVHSFRLKSGEQIKKSKFAAKNEKMKMNKMYLSSINRKNIFGENLLYRAALQNDVDLVHHCIKKGGNVNQPSYAGWTALHEASAAGFYQITSELLKGGADINVKGRYQITPLHDAVMSGHYKVAELLLLNGADPLFRSDSGKCALDEAKDSRMKHLLEHYVPKHHKHLIPAQKNSTNVVDVEDAHQHKKPKYSSKRCIWIVDDENSNRQKQEHVKVHKGSKDSLLINKEDIYEYYQKDSQNTKFGKSKRKQSTLDQIHSEGFRKDNLRNVRDPSTNVSNNKGRRNTKHKNTQGDNGYCNPRKTRAVTSSRRTNRLVSQQRILQTLDGLPKESCKSSSLTLSSLTNGVGNNIKACSVSKDTHTQSLDLSGSQKVQFLELESIDQTEISFSGLSLHKEIKLPSEPFHTDKKQHVSPYKFLENGNSGQKDESFNKWENSVSSIVKENTDDDGGSGDCFTTEKTVISKEVVCSTDCQNHYNCKGNITNVEGMCFQQYFPSEHHYSQENALKVDNLTILPQQEVVTISDSDNTVISEQHFANYEQYIYGTSFDHSLVNPKQTSLACTRTISTHEVSELTSHVERLKRPQDYNPRAPTALMNQTETCIVEKVNDEKDTKKNYTDKDQETSYSSQPFSTVFHSEVKETTEIEKIGQYLPESETICNVDFHPTDNMNKELMNNSQLNHRGEKEISPKPGWTPLHEASSERSNDTTVELLKAGANGNSENLDGILPLHDAVTNSHLKAAEILLQHEANPNQKYQKQKTALDEADDEKMKELLKSYSAIETSSGDENNTVKSPVVQSKRHKQCVCDDCKTVDLPSLSHQGKTRESLMHQTISDILQDIEEKQEHLLTFEIRTPEDAEQYVEKMLQIKQVMDSVLAKQKAERDDLAKKYRMSIESFKHGALREQLANLATRQKSLLVVAKKQRNISLKIQNYKNATSLSGLSLKKLPATPECSNEKDSQKLTSLEKSVQLKSGSLSPATLVCGNIQETQLSLGTCSTVQNGSQKTNICLNSETGRKEEFSGPEQNSKQNDSDYTLDRSPKSSHLDGTEINLPLQPMAFIALADYSQKENDLIKTTAKECESCNPSSAPGAINISEITSVLAQKDPYPSAVTFDQAVSSYDLKRRNKKTASQQPPRPASESLTHHRTAVVGSDTEHQMKPYLKKSASAVPCADDSQSTTSRSFHQRTITKPLNYNIAPKKKYMQIKDLMLLGKINPGNNILEFKTQETTHKASILVSGKIKVENGQIYQNPVTWLKDLLGSDSSVTWNYAWSKVTYLGKELLKYISEEVSLPPEPNWVPQQHRPCLPDHTEDSLSQDQPALVCNFVSGSENGMSKDCPGTHREPIQRNPHYLQINEILLISDQELLPCHIMDQHWKFYAECEELTF
ncbi:ankyrin repeat domain-containing protein 31 [Orycteropus afer afer]|uniref:Ankyrin repeat domain-containing protein 31 n=1 Tax=Orycteropus afer afer TaxID=1230840 RepID=A0AC54ZAQ5_ORYAF|nr:ankyrin repeat domain-containing protein 31 [Orycteropus afer afer]